MSSDNHMASESDLRGIYTDVGNAQSDREGPAHGLCRARFQKRSARNRLRYDPVILIGRSHSTNADHDRLIRSRKYETKQFIAN